MVVYCCWLILLILVPEFGKGESPPYFECEPTWIPYRDSCYRIFQHTSIFPAQSWEEARAYCQVLGGDLLSIGTQDEGRFIKRKLSLYGATPYWLGLYRNSSGEIPNEGWIWMDGTALRYKNWIRGEPNNFNKNEQCGEIYANTGYWNDDTCSKSRSFICERKKGITTPVITTPNVTLIEEPEVVCDFGWKAFRKSCYKISDVRRPWIAAKRDCGNLGGHLLKLDDQAEHIYFYKQIWNLWHSRFWIGLNDPRGNGTWQWESDGSSPQNAKWSAGEPNFIGRERCVEMYGGRLAGLWNNHYCYTYRKYICEKEGGNKNGCPDDWTLFGDHCYQFNLAESQFKNWTAAKQACESIGDFSSLVSIQNESENAFLAKEISFVARSAVWIGLNDRQSENVFKWSDGSKADYRNWIDKNPRNRPWKDCTVLMGMRTDGAWSTELCSASRRYICKRKKAMFNCDAPLGMENGEINDDQITAKILSPSTMGPLKSRLRSSGAWCPQAKDDYLQIDLGSIYKITKIAVQGLATSYCVQYGKDGRTYKPYGSRASTCQELSSDSSAQPHLLKSLQPFIARYIRITPTQGTNKCVRLEFYGCLSEKLVVDGTRRTPWEKIPSSAYQIQINHIQRYWIDARAYCLDQEADLLSIGTAAIAGYIKTRLTRLRPYSWWIGLTDRDYPTMYYWTDTSPVNYIGWSGYSSHNANGCVYWQKYRSLWRATMDCDQAKPFICMRKDPTALTNVAANRLKVGVVGNGVTGVWISSATYYWPLSSVDNGNIFGTIDGRAFGNIRVTTGVNDKPDSALQFSNSGMYIDVPFYAQDCLTFPDTCPSKRLTLSFMASFDATAANWRNVAILDSLGGSKQNSTGISATIDRQKLVFVVSYVDRLWTVSTPIKGDGVWRHYVMTCSPIAIEVFVNGKSAISRAYVPSRRKTIHSKNLKRNFHIGLQTVSKVTSGVLKLAMLAFWEGILAQKDIQVIYKTEFGWCPNGWVAFGMSCYEFTTGRSSWHNARLRCQRLGGDLATISTPVEQALITKQIKTTSWIGLKSIIESETLPRYSGRYYRIFLRRRYFPRPIRPFTTNKINFIWQDRSPARYTNWQAHTRFSYSALRRCVGVDASSGSWGQYACTSNLQSICEKEKDETKADVNTTVVDVPKFTRVCQYSHDFLSCPGGSVIKIQRGFWGRKQRELCRYVSIVDCGLNTGPAITDKLRKQCDGLSSCKVEASNDPKHFGNPCLGVYKYLEVNYTCGLKGTVKTPCPPGWIRSRTNGIACYRLIQSKKSWSDSEKTCKRYGAALISIRDKSEQVVATSLMERVWNTDVWIGLSQDNTSNTFKWSDRAPVSWTNWAVGNPRGAWSGDHCVYMNLERTAKELMYWRGGKCGEKKLFICKKIIDPSGATTTPATASEGSCPYGWKSFKNNCYQYYKYRRSWKAAQRFCYTRYSFLRGSLASVTSKEENDFIANLANTTVWIGLEGRGVYRGHEWSDKTPVSYTNWDVGQPDSYNGRESCTQQLGDVGYWSDVGCGMLKPFVCKRRMTSSTGMGTTAPPTLAQSSRCKKGWYLFSDMCYMISNSSNYKSWHDADTSCKRFGGHLASVTSNEEKDFLRQLVRPRFVYSFWIGLHDLSDGESVYKWTDGTGYGKFIFWKNGEPNNFHGQEDCVSMARADGKWNDNHCSQKKPYICKSKTEDAIKFTVLKPASKVGKNGYCSSGWVANGQYCYEFHADESDYKTWRDAKNTCEKGKNSSATGELVSITNEIEQAFITLNLNGLKTPLWIGMNNFHDYRSYFWADSSPANFYHWNKGQPQSFSSRCVEISSIRRDAGKWSSVPCYNKRGYICKTAAKATPIVPTVSTTTRPTESPSFKCSKEYIQYDESCYMFVNSPKTFDEAVDACRKENAELISVDSEFEQAMLVFLMERSLGTVWIGLSKEPWLALKFTDHSVPHYSYWGPGQPDRPPDQRTCVQANVTGYNVGRWNDVDCSTKNPYVCEIYHGEKKITLEENTTCEAGWKKYRKNCYKYFQQAKSWPAARYICKNNGGDLISIADDVEQDFAMFYFSNMPRTWLWIGLNDRGDEGSYEWSDDSPVTYINWMTNQPNDVGQNQNCVIMDSRNGRWYDWRCVSPYGFVCKKSLECSSKIPLNNKMITVSNDIAADFSVERAILSGNTPQNLTWCPNTTTGIQPRIQVDLYDLVQISSITTKGRTVQDAYVRKHQFVKSFLVEYTTDGYAWQTYSEREVDVKFFANNDGITPVTKTFNPPIVASSIAILPTVIKGQQPCMKLSLQGCKFVCQAALGMSNWRIPDNSITASSAKYPNNAPWDAKIKSSGWCSKINDKNQWIQVNFGRTNLVTKITTFGDTKDSYVTRYMIQISGDGIEWVDYKQNGGVRIFMGNSHAAHPMTHALTDVSQAQYIRIVPLSWKNNICMRFELFGCVAGCNGPLIQKGNNEVSDVKLTSSDPNSNPAYARMDSGKAWCTSAKPGKYLEVDFGKAVRLKAIATKGSPSNYGEPRNVVTYTLALNSRNNKWKKYMLDNSVKYIVAGNLNDSTTLYKYSFPSRGKGNGLIVRKIRIYPKQFTPAGICMRVEFYGCLAEAEIVPTRPSTKQKILEKSIRITSMEWNDNLKDKTSKEFKQASALIVKSVTDLYENNDDSQEGEALRNVKVTELRKGSVIADLRLVFNPMFARNENISKPLLDAISSGNIGQLKVDKDYKENPKQSAIGGSAGNGLSNGTIAGVVVTVLLVLLVVVAVGIYWRYKRKRDLYGPKQFNNPILYSTANTDEFDVE